MNKRAATIGLGAFLLADIVLVALALRPPPVDEASPAVTGAGTTQAATRTPSTPATSQSGTAAPKPAAPVPVERFVVAFDATRAWRATAGSCDDGGAVVQTTVDGGKTWSKGTSPGNAIARIQPMPDGVGFAYAAGPDCTLEEWVTKDDTATWTGPTPIVGGWTRLVSPINQVMTPNDPAAEPCGEKAVLDLSRTTATQAEALCAGGAVMVTNDGGTSWSDSGEAKDAVALSNRVEGTVLSTYAARLHASCSGVQVLKVIVGKNPTEVACVETETTPKAGQVGISVTPVGGWIVVGDETWTSGVDLTTWEQA